MASLLSLEHAWDAIGDLHRQSETDCVRLLLDYIDIPEKTRRRITSEAATLIDHCRKHSDEQAFIDRFLQQYGLNSDEGIALLCLVEALLRVPDEATAELLIAEKISEANWQTARENASSLFVTASKHALELTKRVNAQLPKATARSKFSISGLLRRFSDDLVRSTMVSTVQSFSQAFVCGQSIDEALEKEIGLASYDMLGEGARSLRDAERHFDEYQHALDAIRRRSVPGKPQSKSGMSIKLSAVYPRFEPLKQSEVVSYLAPKITELAIQAAEGDINLTIDAEEADRTELQLRLFSEVARSPKLGGWTGFGIAVQAYSRRAFAIIDWIDALGKAIGKTFMIRLVKGAYWDTEIKRAQVAGLPYFPVYTRKSNTDVSYLACAQKLFRDTQHIFPQFGTHNAHTLIAIEHLSEGRSYERQRIYGMGSLVHDQYRLSRDDNAEPRIYAPAGTNKDLMAYLTRRLIENGSSANFVNALFDPEVSIDSLSHDPMNLIKHRLTHTHPKIPDAKSIYLPHRLNSQGVDLGDSVALGNLRRRVRNWRQHIWEFGDRTSTRRNPADHHEVIGTSQGAATAKSVNNQFRLAHESQSDWNKKSIQDRAACLDRLAEELGTHRDELISLLQREAGKSIADAIAEIREAEDFCRFYAAEARQLFVPRILPSASGETNEWTLHGRGVFGCISPWNFPAAIFIGQIAACLVSGNCVVAKPAPQTPLIATRIIQLAYQAGVPQDALHLSIGGDEVGEYIVRDELLAGVLFTGSCAVSKQIARDLANRDGPLIPLIAETGGLNAMVVDSSALIEQAVDDIVSSAFLSAGQRCSALRLLCVQDDIFDDLIAMLKGAMDALTMGDPSNWHVDIGPVIDSEAQANLERYVRTKHILHAVDFRSDSGFYVNPTLVRVDGVSELEEEQFGPILHVLKYSETKLSALIDQINALGYGLTFGIETRVNQRIDSLSTQIDAGNIYVNRNIVGAVVGSQPFGGMAMSGTGPKAGGPLYLPRLVVEKLVSKNDTATGGNIQLLRLDQE